LVIIPVIGHDFLTHASTLVDPGLAIKSKPKQNKQFFFSHPHLFIQKIDKSFSIMAELVDNPLGPQPGFHRVSQAPRNLADEMQKFPNIPQFNAVDTVLTSGDQ
jgi:hypothetical protein